MRAELSLVLLLAACATASAPQPPPPEPAPVEPPKYFSPTQGQFQCVQWRGTRKIEAQMNQVALETALQGISDVTCWHFKLMPGTGGTITLLAEQKLTVDQLFEAFVKAAAEAKITVKQEAPDSNVYVVYLGP